MGLYQTSIVIQVMVHLTLQLGITVWILMGIFQEDREGQMPRRSCYLIMRYLGPHLGSLRR